MMDTETKVYEILRDMIQTFKTERKVSIKQYAEQINKIIDTKDDAISELLARNERLKRKKRMRNLRPIIQFCAITKKKIREWDCISEASKGLNIDGSSIKKCLDKEHRQAKGYIFMYKKEYDDRVNFLKENLSNVK